jgi:hypothetical protein
MIGQNSLRNHATTFNTAKGGIGTAGRIYLVFEPPADLFCASSDNGTYKNKGFAEATGCKFITCDLHMATEPSSMYVGRVCHSPSSVIWEATLFVFYEDIGS